MTSGRELGRSGARWTTTTKAIPLSSGTFRKKCSKRLDSACRRAETDDWKVGGIGHGPCTDSGLGGMSPRRKRRCARRVPLQLRSEEHKSEFQSLMRIPFDVFCLKKKKQQTELSQYISRYPP